MKKQGRVSELEDHMRFTEVEKHPKGIRTQKEIEDFQRGTSERLLQAIRESNFHPWYPGQPFKQTGMRVLVGISTYVPTELRFLDCIAKVKGHFEDIHLDVFELSLCQSQEEIDACFPGIGPVFQTPAIGVWEDGQLTQTGSNVLGRNLLMRLFEIDKEFEWD